MLPKATLRCALLRNEAAIWRAKADATSDRGLSKLYNNRADLLGQVIRGAELDAPPPPAPVLGRPPPPVIEAETRPRNSIQYTVHPWPVFEHTH